MKFFVDGTAWDSITNRSEKGETSELVDETINIILDKDKIDEFNSVMEDEFPNGCREDEIDFLIENDFNWLMERLEIDEDEFVKYIGSEMMKQHNISVK